MPKSFLKRGANTWVGRTVGSNTSGPRVAGRCDICMAERISVREGDTYLCEECLDLENRRVIDPRPGTPPSL